MPIVTESHRRFFEENGYVVIEDVVPKEKCEAVVDDIYAYTGWDPDDPETWYRPPRERDEHDSRYGWIDMYHSQSMWDTRQDETLYQTFAELLDQEALWVSIDKVNHTPPAHEDHPELNRAFGAHWDEDISELPDVTVQDWGSDAVPYGVQGVLHLRDTPANGGGFNCWPGVYRDVVELAEEAGGDLTVADLDLDEYERVDVGGGAGDLLLWDRLLLHGNGSNRSDVPRIAQYITVDAANFGDVSQRRERIDKWRSGRANVGTDRATSDEDVADDAPATLTPLGRKLLGLDPWPGWLNRS